MEGLKEKVFMDTSNVEDSYSFLNIVRNPDGSLTRPTLCPLVPSQQQQEQKQRQLQLPPTSVLYKDVPLNPSNNTWIRVFRPHLPHPTAPLPIIIYVHGGGFILFSAASLPFHTLCERMAAAVPAIVLSLEYRLAPENGLPAAYDDAVEAIRWVRDHALSDPWMAEPHLADFSRCFFMGSSAGGNITYHAALRATELEPQPPFKLDGVILDQPFFGGVERTESESKLAKDKILPLPATDLMWELALPEGADRDHEFCNPTARGGGDGRVGRLPPCLVRGTTDDPLFDRQASLARLLEERGVRVVGKLEGNGCHGVDNFDDDKARGFLMDVKDFISSLGTGSGGSS